MNDLLFRCVQATGVRIDHACEVGVYRPETSNVRGWIETGVRTTLVEADPLIVDEINRVFGAHRHVAIRPVAVADSDGILLLYRVGASTFGRNVDGSPAVVNDRYVPDERHAFESPAVRFSSIDDGTIDVLSIDIEGGEWFVLKHMVSRPSFISVETHGKRYRNPHLDEILGWMQREGYGAWYRANSDTVFQKGYDGVCEDRSDPLTFVQRIKRAIRGH